MKTNNIAFFLVLCTLSGCATAGGPALSLKRGHGITSSNLAHYAYNDLDYAVADSVHYAIDVGFVHGFVTNDDESIIYSLSQGPALHAGSMEMRAHLGTWPLTRWGRELSDEIGDIYSLVDVPWNPEDHGYDHGVIPGPGGAGIGCLHATPLRYGDIDEDGNGEIVLFLGRSSFGVPVGHLDMVLFSPERERIVFSVRLAIADVGGETAQRELDHSKFIGYPQFTSSENQKGLGVPAMQAFAKVFFGDFNDDGVSDILVWRKRYESLSIGDSQRGFVRASELFNHYQAGEQDYLPQSTPEATIRSWLATNNLTWQSGFPSHSECPGEEGQLIPEMHDPLLNDPDVLQ